MFKHPLFNNTDYSHQVFSIDEAAQYLRVSRAFLYKLLKSGKLVGKKIGSRRLITGSAIQKLLSD
jgi:excisionase family DNA binding protein